MHDLDRALGDIRNIRRQVARSTDFRGYGPATVAATAAIGTLAAVAQAISLPDPANHITGYLAIWLSSAFLSAALAGRRCTYAVVAFIRECRMR